MFCAPELIFDGIEGDVSRFRRYRGRRDPFSCFALTNSFSAVLRATGPVFDSTEVVGSRFHVLRSRAHFRRYRWCRIPFSCFALPDIFSAVRRASGSVFIVCAPELVFGGSEGVGSRFNVLRAHTCFRQYRGRQVLFLIFALPDSFSAVSRVSGLVFMFCALGLIFGGNEGVGSLFHVLISRSRFLRYRGRWDLFSCFALPDSFSAAPGVAGPFSCFAHTISFSAVPTASSPIFIFCAPGHVFGGAEDVGSRFHVLRSWTRFRRYRGRRLSFLCFALPYSFAVVLRASDPVFMF
jgi:hypothetical protein